MSKNIIIGMDEAGLGPKLGPLVISMNLFETERDLQALSMKEIMSDVLALDAGLDSIRVRVMDSKILYRGVHGFAFLEKTALSFWYACHQTIPPTLGAWLSGTCPEVAAHLEECPWYGPDPLRLTLPRIVHPELIVKSGIAIREVMERTETWLVSIKQKVLTAPVLNRMIDRLGLKSEAEMEALFSMLAQALDEHQSRLFQVEIDKLGGRNFYAGPITRFLQATQIHALEEGPQASTYIFPCNHSQVDIRFLCKGDSRKFHIALASIMSKYVRELFMFLLNRYWRSLLPEIRPTAGYPVDASRFLREVTPRALEAGLDPSLFTRIK
ncbi:MAG: hypothetical protein ABIK28_18720 [Planctomycetota bacterium]